jgi:hypothetical protein
MAARHTFKKKAIDIVQGGSKRRQQLRTLLGELQAQCAHIRRIGRFVQVPQLHPPCDLVCYVRSGNMQMFSKALDADQPSRSRCEIASRTANSAPPKPIDRAMARRSACMRAAAANSSAMNCRNSASLSSVDPAMLLFAAAFLPGGRGDRSGWSWLLRYGIER